MAPARSRWAILAALIFTGACGPVPPPGPPGPPPDACAGVACPEGSHCVDGKCIVDPPPPPPPETGRPAAPLGTAVEQRQTGGKFKYDVVGVIPVWPPDGPDGTAPSSFLLDGRKIPYLWPLFSAEWADAAKAKGVTDLYVRFGPEPKSNACCGLEEVGGPLLDADPTQLNPAYWKVFHQAMRRATANGQRVLMSLGPDGWRVKHWAWDHNPQMLRGAPSLVDRHMLKAGATVDLPWSFEENQHLMDVPLSAPVKRWIQQVAFETCNYSNMYVELSNESDLTPGWTPDWERALYYEWRHAEQQPGCGLVIHMVGSNSRDEGGPYDFMISHNPNENLESNGARPVVANEYNPALAPATVQARLCEAKANGQAFWYWRSDGDDAAFQQTMDALECGAPPPVGACPYPQPDRERLVINLACDEKSICDATPQNSGDFTYCSYIGMGDYNGQPRYTCPMRNECGDGPASDVPGAINYQCDKRLACEQYALQRYAPLWFSDGAVTLLDANGFRVKVEGTWVEACDGLGQHCTRREYRDGQWVKP